MGIRFRVVTAKGKQYAAIAENFRDPVTGKSRTTCIKSYGNLAALKALNPNIEEELKEEAARLEKSRSTGEEADQSNYFRCRSSEKVTAEVSRCFAPGEAILRRTWENLKLHELLSRIDTEKKLGCNKAGAAGSTQGRHQAGRAAPKVDLGALQRFYPGLFTP